jgi:hypothetical protein
MTEGHFIQSKAIRTPTKDLSSFGSTVWGYKSPKGSCWRILFTIILNGTNQTWAIIAL